jgi:hypothetical protein
MVGVGEKVVERLGIGHAAAEGIVDLLHAEGGDAQPLCGAVSGQGRHSGEQAGVGDDDIICAGGGRTDVAHGGAGDGGGRAPRRGRQQVVGA